MDEGSSSAVCSRSLLNAHCQLQASWESVGTQGHESSSGERAARLHVISSLAQTALGTEHADAMPAVADSLARMTGQVLSSAHMCTRRPAHMQWQR